MADLMTTSDLTASPTLMAAPTASPIITAADVSKKGLGSLGTNLPTTTSPVPGGMDQIGRAHV